MKAAKCPHCKTLAKPDLKDRFSYCRCSLTFMRRNADGGWTMGGPDGVTLVEEENEE